MFPGRLQCFLEHFWNDRKCDQIWTLGPRIYHQNISNNTRKLWGASLKILLSISENMKFCKCWKVYVHNFWNVTIWFFENWKVERGIWNLEIENLEMGHLKIDHWQLASLSNLQMLKCKFEIRKYEIWNLENFKVWQLEIWTLEMSGM